MGQSSNESNTYPPLTFSPPLNCTITVNKPARIPGKPRLCWQATLGREDYERMCYEKSEVQVWTNCTGTASEQWSAIPFQRRTTTSLMAPNDVECFDLSMIECGTQTKDNQILLEALLPISSSVIPTMEFTYRVVYASGRTDWLGTDETNGRVTFSVAEEYDCLEAENCIDNDENAQAFQWTCVLSEPMVIAKLPVNGANWNGWGFKTLNPGYSDISHFVGVNSESITGPVVALALLPQVHWDTHVIYPPVLYTVKNGTMSLEGYNVLLHPGEGESTQLNAYNSTSTWKDYMPPKLSFLDIQTSDFLGVSVNTHANFGYLHILPITGAQSVIALSWSDIASLVTSSSVLLFDSRLRIIKFLPALAPIERLRIAMGPLGGDLMVVPAYVLSTSISVAFLNDHGSIAELETSASIGSEHSSSSSQDFTSESSHLSAESLGSSPVTIVETHPKSHPFILRELLFFVVYMFQYFWTHFFSTFSTGLSSGSRGEPIVHPLPISQDASCAPRLAFKVTGKAPLLVYGEDASRLRILLGGKLFQATPKDIGGEHWLIENISESDTDDSQRRIEISLEE